MKQKTRKIITVCMFLGAIVATLFFISLDGAPEAETTTSIHPDPHVRWEQWPVGGMILINPALPDSANAAAIPDGSWLWIPLRGSTDSTGVRADT